MEATAQVQGWKDRFEMAKARYEQSLQSGDPRVQDWPLMQTPWLNLGIVCAYLVVCYVGPRLMAGRKPFDLKPLIVVYNFIMVLMSLYMAVELFMLSLALNLSYQCDLVSYSDDKDNLRLASVLWLYYFSKIIELLDTVFFILRKKDNQISFLHVYHHSTMVLLWWIGIKWFAGGASFFSAMVNSSIHVIMYFYYFLSSCGPMFRRFLWWKKYLTMIQLLQFMVVMGHTLNSLRVDCEFDIRPRITLAIYLMSHILLFSNFFRQTYIRPKPAPRSDKAASNEGLSSSPESNGTPSGATADSKKDV